MLSKLVVFVNGQEEFFINLNADDEDLDEEDTSSSIEDEDEDLTPPSAEDEDLDKEDTSPSIEDEHVDWTSPYENECFMFTQEQDSQPLKFYNVSRKNYYSHDKKNIL